jgi:aerobic-type carbon monoxide dehydrogenase small subunit (CoxS/CutS family)
MATNLKITVNGKAWPVASSPDTPLLYVLTNELHLHGPRFGCGLAQCGSCSVLVDDKEIRSCVTPVATVTDRAITTLEGLPAWYARKHGLKEAPSLHPLQQAFIAELLANNPKPSEVEIRRTMNGHLCRCGTYPRIMKAIQVASRTVSGDTP